MAPWRASIVLFFAATSLSEDLDVSIILLDEHGTMPTQIGVLSPSTSRAGGARALCDRIALSSAEDSRAFHPECVRSVERAAESLIRVANLTSRASPSWLARHPALEAANDDELTFCEGDQIWQIEEPDEYGWTLEV